MQTEVSISAFTALLQQEGYLDIETKVARANFTSKPHTHPFDVRALILEGSFTLICGDKTLTCGPGEQFALTRDIEHVESYGAQDVTYLVGRRHPITA